MGFVRKTVAKVSDDILGFDPNGGGIYNIPIIGDVLEVVRDEVGDPAAILTTIGLAAIGVPPVLAGAAGGTVGAANAGGNLLEGALLGGAGAAVGGAAYGAASNAGAGAILSGAAGGAAAGATGAALTGGDILGGALKGGLSGGVMGAGGELVDATRSWYNNANSTVSDLPGVYGDAFARMPGEVATGAGNVYNAVKTYDGNYLTLVTDAVGNVYTQVKDAGGYIVDTVNGILDNNTYDDYATGAPDGPGWNTDMTEGDIIPYDQLDQIDYGDYATGPSDGPGWTTTPIDQPVDYNDPANAPGYIPIEAVAPVARGAYDNVPRLPVNFASYGDVEIKGGLNPGFIEPQAFYQTTRPEQAQYSWGSKPYQPLNEGDAFSPEMYNQAYAPETPWGIQQMASALTPQELQALLSGQAYQPQDFGVATRREAYTPVTGTPSASGQILLPTNRG